jgi:ABC-type Fe3+-siderophore transport system permease subunit
VNRRAALVAFVLLMACMLGVLVDVAPRAAAHLLLLAAIAVSALGGALVGLLVGEAQEAAQKESSIDPDEGIGTIK